MGELRVIAGIARGRRLRTVPGDSTRPITDRTKESLFNILGPDMQDATFLDLFAGTGSVGIEALSRGAAFARFLDINRLAIETIRSNIETTGFTRQSQVLRQDAFQHLAQPPDRTFDYIYIAPPQYKDLWRRALLALEANPGWCSPDAWVIAQIHPVEYDETKGVPDFHLERLVEFDQRRYGSTLLIFYELSASSQK